MDDRVNTIAGWVLFAGIIALGSSIVAGEVFHAERPDVMGFPIEGVEEEAGDEGEQPIAFYLASADAAQGEQVYKKCIACHTINQGGADMLGPNLWGIMGSPIAQGGYAFSPALSSVGGSWNWDNMSEWLKSPRNFATGTKMTFAGLGRPEERAAVMLYMNQNSSNPLPVPAAPAGSPAADEGAPEAGEADAHQAPQQPVLDEPGERGGGPAAQPGPDSPQQ